MRLRNLVLGAILVAAGIAGLAYSMPVVSSSISLASKSEPAALGKAPLPTLPSNDTAILGIEIASIPALVAGIFLMAIGEPKLPNVDKSPSELG